MKKILDKLKQPIRINKKMFLFLGILVLVGVASGSLLVTVLSSEDKTLVKEYLINFIQSIQQNKLNTLQCFLNSICSNGIYFLVIWLLGISVIGIPVVILIFFIKSFTLGFSIGSLISIYQLKGCMISFIYIFPHQIINIFLYCLITLYSISLSIKIISSAIRKKSLDFKSIMNRYIFILVVCIIFSIITSLYEAFIMPQLIKWIFTFIS